MLSFLNQTLGGTRLDRQGECLPLAALQAISEKFQGKRIPLHQKHSMAETSIGYIENLCTVPDGENLGDWSLIGDVYLTHGELDEALKGFSISLTLPLREVEDPELLLYIPYPYYNDSALIEGLSTDSTLSIGKWVKKGSDPSTWAIFGATIVFAITPIWDDFYKRKIAPAVDRFLETHFLRLQEAGINLEHVQLLIYESHQVEIRFIPATGKERFCFSTELLCAGISQVIEYLNQDPKAKQLGVERVILSYDVGCRAYTLLRVEYKNGEVEHHL